MEVGVGTGKYKAAVVVSVRKVTTNFIIGADFLGAHNCDLSLRQKFFTIGEQQVRCVPEHTKVTRAKLKLARRVQVLPHTEVVVKCQATSNVKRFDMPYAIAQPADNSWRYAEDGLVIGSSLTAPGSGMHQLPVMNLSNAPRTLPARTRIGDLNPATSLRQTCEMFEAEPELSDWDSDDEELLLDVQGTTKTGTKTQGAQSYSNARVYPRMDPERLPEHLKPLMLDLSEDITIREREELAAAIYEYQDVFSSGPDDMGCTDLVTHSIDTGEHRPIRLPPRRLPITKQDVEKAEVQKMVDKGVIEPCQSSWASPVVSVTKKDGSTRFCVDYQKVNEVTRKDAHPLPRIDKTLDALRGSRYFSTLDLYSGYWQVKMDPKDIDKTAFMTKQGLFRFTVMPFALRQCTCHL